MEPLTCYDIARYVLTDKRPYTFRRCYGRRMDTTARTCQADYYPGPCSPEGPLFDVVYSSSIDRSKVLDRTQTCHAHGQQVIDRHHAANGIAPVELVRVAEPEVEAGPASGPYFSGPVVRVYDETNAAAVARVDAPVIASSPKGVRLVLDVAGIMYRVVAEDGALAVTVIEGATGQAVNLRIALRHGNQAILSSDTDRPCGSKTDDGDTVCILPAEHTGPHEDGS